MVLLVYVVVVVLVLVLHPYCLSRKTYVHYTSWHLVFSISKDFEIQQTLNLNFETSTPSFQTHARRVTDGHHEHQRHQPASTSTSLHLVKQASMSSASASCRGKKLYS
jgi:hypothetical protein